MTRDSRPPGRDARGGPVTIPARPQTTEPPSPEVLAFMLALGSVIRADTLRAILAALPDPSAEVRYRRQLCKTAFRDGYRAGYQRGRRDEADQRDRAWTAAAGPVARGGPTHAELESRRWGPGGREHFGDPWPGDFPGRRHG